MRTAVKLGSYAVGLVAVFAASIGVGQAVGPPGGAVDPVGHAAEGSGGHGEPAADSVARLPGGLQVAEDGYRLVPVSRSLATAGRQPFSFQIIGPDGAPVTAYTPTHERDLHLIVAGRDLSGFQHVHPAMAADGTWTVPMRVAAPGTYRVFADFRPAARADGLTLGVDVPAPGDYRPVPLPAVSRTATVDGYTVALAGDLVAGRSADLTLTVSRNGVPVTDLDPYLGAYGHLVALREGDLAYLHVHPHETKAAGPAVTFAAEVPSVGTYRLFLDFQHHGVVRTAAFTATTHGHE